MAYRDEWIETGSELPYAVWLEFRRAEAERELLTVRAKSTHDCTDFTCPICGGGPDV